MVSKGLSKNLPNFQGIDLNGNLYDFRCIPIIRSISTNVGSPKGQLLKINGYGFGDISNVTVIAGDYPCNVLYADTYDITCKVDVNALNQSYFIKGSGIEKWVYDGKSNNALNIQNQIFQKTFWAHNITLPLISHSFENAIDRIVVDDS